MPFASTIRKQILSALNGHVIPLLQTHTVAQVLAAPPFYFTGVESIVEQKVLLRDSNTNPMDVVSNLPEARMGSRRIGLLGFSYSGCSVEKIGVTRQMAKNLKHHNLPVPPGVTTFRLGSPGAIYVPPHVPHTGNSLSQGEDVHRVLLLWFAEEEFWICLHDAAAGGTHNLNITDSAFQQMKQAYVQALEKQDFSGAQMILLDLMRRLSDYLANHAATVNNSAWPTFEENSILVAPHVSALNAQYCYTVIDYIQFHLHTPLSLQVLAEVCDITVPHLCNIFRKSTGMTLMNYVTNHRLRAAELMLINTQESINDISQLTGFASSHSFAGAFRRHFGMSASQYRAKNLIK